MITETQSEIIQTRINNSKQVLALAGITEIMAYRAILTEADAYALWEIVNV